jgi:light-regulated signal transduction histidine kinase (bacteriophytochrome)
MDLARASGAAICDEVDCLTAGDVPSRENIMQIVRWLASEKKETFSTSMLSQHFAPAAEWTDVSSGLLAVALSSKRPYYLLWFRPERRQKIGWAGDPNKSVISKDNAPRLSPRGSFALWEEERRATAEPWIDAEIEAASDLRRTVLDLLLAKAEEIAAVNEELEVANQHLSDVAVELESQADELIRQRADREELLAQAELARSEAERANRAKSDFLAMMSHELRTPLNAIGGYAEMLQLGVRGPVSEIQMTDLQRIQHNQRHLLSLINSILNFARIEAGQGQIVIGPVSVSQMLAELETMIHPQLRDKKLVFRVEPPAQGLGVSADVQKVRQILVNLATNAMKFTPDGGSITVSARRAGETVEIDVTDTGIGIDAAQQASIFEPFIQVRPHGPDRRHDGVGLGLAISRELARAMRGDLSVRSEPGKGSTFTVTLPAT